MSLKSSDDPSRYISVQQTLVEPIVNAIRVPDFKVECPIKSSRIWSALTAHPEDFSHKRDVLIGGDALTFCMTVALQGCFPRSAKLINVRPSHDDMFLVLIVCYVIFFFFVFVIL